LRTNKARTSRAKAMMSDDELLTGLTPDESAALLRLAHEAGYSSIYEFAKSKLKEAVRGHLQDVEQAAGKPDHIKLKRAITELKRLHQELRVFVAESIAEVDQVSFGQDEQPSWDLQDDGNNSKIDVESFLVEGDELEQLAAEAFAKSPQLGAFTATDATSFPQTSDLSETLPSGTKLAKRTSVKREQSKEEGETETGDKPSDLSGGLPPRKRPK